jgi:hypothetical protein
MAVDELNGKDKLMPSPRRRRAITTPSSSSRWSAGARCDPSATLWISG